MKKGILEESTSPWASATHCVGKGQGEVRVVVDTRAVNNKTVPDPYPLPRLDQVLDTVANSKYISTLDLNSGYYQIPVRAEDRPKTAIITHQGKYQFTRMPFGFKGAPACFQRLMDKLFKNEPQIKAYMDDIVIFSPTWEEHLKALETAFTILEQAGLTAKKKKCQLIKRDMNFLGHTLKEGRINTQQAKVAAVRNFIKPTTKTEMRSFLGLAGFYRKFVSGFSTIAEPLHAMTKQGAPKDLVWTREADEAMEELKRRITSAPALASADTSKPYILQTDASDVGLGAVLAQEQDGAEHPIAFFSRSLNTAERNYSTTEKECLAVVEGVKAFGIYLIGAEFTVVTDHAALKSLQTTTKSGPRVTRWALALQPYNFKVQHRAGKENSNADGLSRQAWKLDQLELPTSILRNSEVGQQVSQMGGRVVPGGGALCKEGRMLGSSPNRGQETL